MTLALCAVLVAPPALRAAAAMLGGAFAVGVGYAVLVLGWHYPSDVLGGFLVAGLWTSLAVAVLHRVEAPEPARRPLWEPVAGLAGGAGVVAAVVLGVRADTVALYTFERPTFAAGALTIALLALVLVTTVSAASTRGAPQAR
jgi:membrane-associated phospholipid phosphatase